MTHLRVQKLSFYGYGALVALAKNVPPVSWLAWKHGPENRALFDQLRDFHSEPIEPSVWCSLNAPALTSEHESILQQVLAVYGLLDTRELREQSHEERVWRETPQSELIAPLLLREWAIETFVSKVRLPSLAAGFAWLELEGIEPTHFPTFKSLADEGSRIAKAC